MRDWSARRRRQRSLQSTDCAVERQPVILQNFSSRAARVSDNRGKHNGAVDIASAATAGGSSGGF
jgi:hypothetical protein